MKIAVIQFNASDNKKDNVQRAKALTEQAIAAGASWICLPEIFSFRGKLLNTETLTTVPESIPGETTQAFSALAKAHRVSILLGSILEKAENDKPFNTSVLIGPNGSICAKYRKIKLFDACVDGKMIREADFFEGGKETALCSVDDFKVGLSICYDLRFPDHFLKYAAQGVHIITVPSCFTKTTGQAHFETLLRARAIENLCYIVAPNQTGQDARGIEAYGNSMVIAPWGEVIARASGDQEEIIYADIAMEPITQARAKLPGIIKD